VTGIPRYFFDDKKRKKSIKQEDRVAKKIGGRRQVASGAFPGHRGDVRSDELLVECKRTDKKSISVTIAYLKKISKEASAYGRTPAVSISFEGIKPAFEGAPSLVDQDWVLIPARFLTEMLGADRDEDGES
jgi:hypothetical protein